MYGSSAMLVSQDWQSVSDGFVLLIGGWYLSLLLFIITFPVAAYGAAKWLNRGAPPGGCSVRVSMAICLVSGVASIVLRFVLRLWAA